MEKVADILLGDADPGINRVLASLPEESDVWDLRFNQDEEMFLVLESDYEVLPFEVHHDVRSIHPSERYRRMITSLVSDLSQRLPGTFRNLSWYFQPHDLFHPVFLQPMASRSGKRYLYQFRLNLTFHGQRSEIVERGTNDLTPHFRTKNLVCDSLVLPLETWASEGAGRALRLAKLFPNTFVGEQGLGYVRMGQWIDRDLTRILGKAALEPGRRNFPFQPLQCHKGTLAVACTDFSERGRRWGASTLELAWDLVSPWADQLQQDLKVESYREDHPLIDLLRARWQGRLATRWGDFRLEAYLNEFEQKEYQFHGAC